MNPTSSSFPIQPLSRFTSSAPAVIKRPVEIACFSYDSDHKLLIDSTESLRYYYTPPLGVSLSEGFSTFENIDDTADEHLDGLIKTLMERERRMGARTTADVIAYRGMLTKVCEEEAINTRAEEIKEEEANIVLRADDDSTIYT